MGAEYSSSVAWRCESGGTEGHCFTSIASLFYESAVQMLGVQRNTKFHGFCCCTNILIGNNKMLNKNLATSYTSTLPSVLLQAMQTPLLSLDNI